MFSIYFELSISDALKHNQKIDMFREFSMLFYIMFCFCSNAWICVPNNISMFPLNCRSDLADARAFYMTSFILHRFLCISLAFIC